VLVAVLGAELPERAAGDRAMKRRSFKIKFWLGLAAAALVVGGCVPYYSPAVPTATNVLPTWPIPADTQTGPPPIASLPAATDVAPPADQIADPVRPAALCGDWYRQSNYGGRWPATSTWWEYACTDIDSQYHDTCTGVSCNAWCPDCWQETQAWTDYFYWDGANAVF
jgi:hypothetical protein